MGYCISSLITGLCVGIAFGLSISASANMWWVRYRESSDFEAFAGLWKLCTNINKTENCTWLWDLQDFSSQSEYRVILSKVKPCVPIAIQRFLQIWSGYCANKIRWSFLREKIALICFYEQYI